MQTVSPPNKELHTTQPAQDAKPRVYHNASPSRSCTSPYRTTAQYAPVVRPRPVCIYIYIYIDKRVALQLCRVILGMSDMRVCHCRRRAALSAHINQLSQFLECATFSPISCSFNFRLGFKCKLHTFSLICNLYVAD